MGWYEAIKDGINLDQKADNLPLVQSLLDAQKQIMDLQNKNNSLKKEIVRLQGIEDLSKQVERHNDAYITLKNDSNNIIYCLCCWDTKKILVQGNIIDTGKYKCSFCNNEGYFDREDFHRGQAEAMSCFVRGTR